VIFSSYSDFRTSFQTMFDGDDISTSDMSGDVLDLIIAAGERRIYREIKSSTQDTALSLTTTNNAAPLPADFIELRGSPWVGQKAVAVYAPWEVLTTKVNLNTSSSTRSPVLYSFQSDTIFFYPLQADGTVITGQYYKKFADISTGLNALFTRHSDLFLYAALSESAPFLGEMTRLPIWEQKYVSLAQAVNEEERRRVTRGSKLRTRVA